MTAEDLLSRDSILAPRPPPNPVRRECPTLCVGMTKKERRGARDRLADDVIDERLAGARRTAPFSARRGLCAPRGPAIPRLATVWQLPFWTTSSSTRADASWPGNDSGGSNPYLCVRPGEKPDLFHRLGATSCRQEGYYPSAAAQFTQFYCGPSVFLHLN